jgi:hypothetical protein
MFHVIDLPCEVDLSKAKASFNDGRLEVVMPKAAPARSVRVETKQGLPAEGSTSVQEAGGIGAAGSPPAVTGANEPIVKAQTASSRR